MGKASGRGAGAAPPSKALATAVLSALLLPAMAASEAPSAKAPEVMSEAGKYRPENDPAFAEPYVDIDEWRDAPVRHRYVHGGFSGTQTRFSFYLPPREQYQGRFFQHITPVPDNENLAVEVPAGAFNKIGSAFESGAYFVETNGGGRIGLTGGAQGDSTIGAYRANAAAAAFSREIAMEMYGGKRPFGYAYGGSGGGYRTIGGMENTRGVWDGAVPYVIGSTMAIPNMFTVRMQALRVLRDRFAGIVDALEPGGSGDPYAGLSAREAAVLGEAEQMGFPMASWFGYEAMGLHGFAALYGGVAAADPTYFTDFWTKPGYLGHDHPEYFAGDRIRFKTTIAEPITAAEAARSAPGEPARGGTVRGAVDTAFKDSPETGDQILGFRLSETPPPTYFLGGELIVSSGKASGSKLMLSKLDGNVVMLGVVDPVAAAHVEPGDQVTVDNSNFLAMESYHRHQVPGPEFSVWDQFRGEGGKPLYPQRPMLLGPLFVRSTAGSLQTGDFDGKMIVVASLWDREAVPWQAHWYRQQVEKHLGTRTDEHLRLWFSEHALHGDHPETESPDRVVSYVPVLQQALRDLAMWVENEVTPPASTAYTIVGGQVVVPDDAARRKGIQPVVRLEVNGSERAVVRAGELVRFSGTISVPPQAGAVIAADWEFEGAGEFSAPSPVPLGAREATVTMTYRFEKPGTYFPALRGTLHRRGDASATYRRVSNIDRVRVEVR